MGKMWAVLVALLCAFVACSESVVADGGIVKICQVGNDIYGEAAGDKSGESISVSADGNVIAIGAPFNSGQSSRAGHVRVLTLDQATGLWSQMGSDIDGISSNDLSGAAVSLSADGNTVAIGAPYHDSGGQQESGHVRIFTFDNGSWLQLGGDIDGEAAFNNFGRGLSLSADGNRVAIGAPYHGPSAMHTAGKAYIYTRAGDLVAEFDGEANNDEFGNRVFLSADGNTVAIGGASNDDSGSDAGHVRVFRDKGGAGWVQLGGDIDGEAAGDRSGLSISLSADGNVIAIGAPFNSGQRFGAGHVRVFTFDNGSWLQLGGDIDGEAAGDEFGKSVSLSADGKTVAIGGLLNDGPNGQDAGHVRIFTWEDDGDWLQLGGDIGGEAAGDRYGESVSLSADGNTIAIGAPYHDSGGKQDSGHVRVFGLSCLKSFDFFCTELLQDGALPDCLSPNFEFNYNLSRVDFSERLLTCADRLPDNKTFFVDASLRCLDPMKPLESDDTVRVTKRIYLLEKLPAQAYETHLKYLRQVPVSDFCEQPCDCGQVRNSSTGVCVDLISVTDVLESARALSLCETRGDSLPLAPGSYAILALSCARALDYPSSSDHVDVVFSEIESVAAALSLGPALSFARSLRMDKRFPIGSAVVPLLPSDFVKTKVDNFADSLDTFIEKMGDAQREIQDDQDQVNKWLTNFGSQTTTMLASVGDVSTQIDASLLQVDELFTMTDKTLEQVNAAEATVQAALEQVSAAHDKYLDKVQTLEEKELLVAKRKAVFDLVFACFSLAATVLSFGSAAAAKAGTKAGLKSVFKSQAREEAILAGASFSAQLLASKDDLNAAQVKAAALDALPIAGDIMNMVESIDVLKNYDAKLDEIKKNTQAKRDASYVAMEEVQSVLNELAAKVTSMALTLLEAVEWLRSDSVHISSTVVDPALLESPLVWKQTRDLILQHLADLDLCPAPGSSNPHKRRVLLGKEKTSLLDSLERRRRRRRLGQQLELLQSHPFARVLGRKDADEERAAAAAAWNTRQDTCSGFGKALDEFAEWGAQAQTLFFQTVWAIRKHIVLENQLDGLLNSTATWQEATDDLENEQKTLDEKLALLRLNQALQMLSYEMNGKELIESACRSFRYSYPQVFYADESLTVSGESEDVQLKVDTSSCKAFFSHNPGLQAKDLIDKKLGLLQRALGQTATGQDFITKWIELVFQNGLDRPTPSELGPVCDIKSRNFLADLLNKGSAYINILPHSFPAGEDGGNDYVNAQVEQMQLVFFDKDGNLLPYQKSSGKQDTVVINVSPSTTSEMSKFIPVTETDSQQPYYQEIAFVLEETIVERFAYSPPSGSGAAQRCETKELNVVDGTAVCIGVSYPGGQEIDRIQAPLYGKWDFSLPTGWPQGQPTPAYAKLKAIIKAENGKTVDMVPFLKLVGERANTSTTLAQGLGRVCGGVDFQPAQSTITTVVDQEPQQTSVPITIIAVGAAVGGLFLILVAIVLFRTNKSKKQTDPVLSIEVAKTDQKL